MERFCVAVSAFSYVACCWFIVRLLVLTVVYVGASDDALIHVVYTFRPFLDPILGLAALAILAGIASDL